MDSLDVIQVPTLSLLSSSGNNTSSGQSALPKTINKIVKKKLYKRTTTRTSPTSSSLRRSSSGKSSSPYRNRRHKWGTLYPDGAKTSLGNFFNRRKSRKSIDTTPSSRRSVVLPVAGPANRSTSTSSSTQGQISTPDRKSPYTPHSEQDATIIESEDDDNENSITPSPIRDSPLYGRKPRRRNANPSTATVASSSSLYPRLPTGTSTNFVRYHSEPKDDSTIDTDMIGKLREGPKGEVMNHKPGQVYTAAMEGEDSHLKIGFTRNIDKRMIELNSTKKHARIYNVADTTTPGAQSRLFNGYHAEQIIHLELYNFRRIAIVRQETEWFEIGKEEAHQVCHKWRKWLMQCAPYDENQQLTEFWRERLYLMETYNPYNASKHGCLHKRWMEFLSPTWWDKTSYEILIAWRKISNWWTWIFKNYPIIATLLGIVFWASNGVMSFLLCISLVLVVWAGVATAKEEDKRS